MSGSNPARAGLTDQYGSGVGRKRIITFASGDPLCHIGLAIGNRQHGQLERLEEDGWP